MRRLSALILLALLASLFALPTSSTRAAGLVVNETPNPPETSGAGYRFIASADTAFGQGVTIEVHQLGTGTYTRTACTYLNNSNLPAGTFARYECNTGQSFAVGATVEYQFAVCDYGSLFDNCQAYTGFQWQFSVQGQSGDIQWDGLGHNSFDSYYRSPFGAVEAGTPVTLRFRSFPFDIDGVSLRVYTYDPALNDTTGPVDYPLSYLEDRSENGINYAIWSITLNTPATPAILYYKFRVSDQSDVDWYSDDGANDHDNLGQGGFGLASDNEPFPAYQLTVFDPSFATPEWLHNANVYQIFPDRFRNGDTSNDYCLGENADCPVFYGSEEIIAYDTWNSEICNPRNTSPGAPCPNAYGNQFYGGDLWGVIDQLDYIQGAGFDTLYFTPVFKARSNHRYDTDDYLEIDPALGGDAAFEALVEALKQRGMYLILDGVFNHTSSDSRYFDRYGRYDSDGACESTSSQFRAWFEFFNTNTPCSGGDYAGWFGYDSLSVLTDNSDAVRDFIFRTGASSVMGYWNEQGVNGWRFDVADEISHDWWREYRGYAKASDADGPLIGEVWPDASRFLLGDQLDSVMNYRFRKNVLGFARDQFDWTDNDNNGNNVIVALTPSQFDHAMRSVREDYPLPATLAMLNLLDSHDTNRARFVLSVLGESESQSKDRLKLAALFQYTYLGAPMTYYGNEAGIDSPGQVADNILQDDPYNRAPFPWADEAGDDTIYGPVDQTLVNYYSTLANIRKQYPALRSGEFITLLTGDTTPSSSDNDSYAFARTLAGESSAIVALNQGAAANSASIPVATLFADGVVLNDLLNGGSYTVSGGRINLSIAARGGAILLPAPAGVDTAAPLAQATLVPAANANGWNNSAVTVQLSGSDSGSGVKELRHWVNAGAVVVTTGDAASVPVASEGNTSVAVRAIDNAGNISQLASVTVRIDTSAPSVAIEGIVAGASYPFDALPTPTCSAGDVGSGLDGAATLSISGGDGSGLGTLTATCSATDLAGNTSQAGVSYTVVGYNFSGFLKPVENLPAMNVVRAGSAVPIKFSLSGDQGLDIIWATFPRAQSIACSSGEATNEVIETGTAGASSLSYDALSDQYTYVWKTDPNWSGTCRQFILKLKDGSIHMLNFRFR